jgi:hypothetical protein
VRIPRRIHCIGDKARCREPYVGGEVLERKLAALPGRLSFDA